MSHYDCRHCGDDCFNVNGYATCAGALKEEQEDRKQRIQYNLRRLEAFTEDLELVQNPETKELLQREIDLLT